MGTISDQGTATDPIVMACISEAPGLTHDWTGRGLCCWCNATRCKSEHRHEGRCNNPIGHREKNHTGQAGYVWCDPTPIYTSE